MRGKMKADAREERRRPFMDVLNVKEETRRDGDGDEVGERMWRVGFGVYVRWNYGGFRFGLCEGFFGKM